jgi:hypothetical protein
MKTRAMTQDVWRDDGGDYLKKGPFPKEPTSLQVQQESRDSSTGHCVLRVIPRHADRVHYEEGGSPATVNSPPVTNGRLDTTALKISFLAVDTSGVHQAGPPVAWQNIIEVKFDLKYRNGAQHLTLKALPQGTIHYSLDGSDPKNGAVYNGEFAVPAGTQLVQAIAEHAGIISGATRVIIPATSGNGGTQFKPSPTQKALWTRPLSRGDRGGSYRLLAALRRHAAKVSGATINVSVGRSEDWINVSFGRSIVRSAAQIEEIVERYSKELQEKEKGSTVEVALDILQTSFDSGAALEEAAKELDEPLNSDEVKQ